MFKRRYDLGHNYSKIATIYDEVATEEGSDRRRSRGEMAQRKQRKRRRTLTKAEVKDQKKVEANKSRTEPSHNYTNR